MKIHWGDPVSQSIGGWDRGVSLEFETEAEHDQAVVVVRALAIYAERNVRYKDNWKRMGYRGMLVRVRERAERLWDALWSAPSDYGCEAPEVLDDAYDLINFAAFLVRGAKDGNRDGSWWGPPDA